MYSYDFSNHLHVLNTLLFEPLLLFSKVFNNFIRPMRLALSVAVTPYFDKAVDAVQRKTKVNKKVAIGIVVFLANICGTTSLMSLGVYIASLLAGVSIFPSKVV